MPNHGSGWTRWFRSERRTQLASRAAAATHGVEILGLYPITRDDPCDGSVAYAWNPIVLFSSGEAALGITALVDPAGDKRANPRNWTRWRRTSAGYDYWSQGGWRPVSSTIDAAPAGFKLEGRYAHEKHSGHGDGSGVLSARWRSVAFDRSGHFTIESGGSSEGPRFTAAARTTIIDGAYDIAGYRLTLRHHSGHVDTHSIVLIHDKKVIWLDGMEYIRQR
jgi:hypothetical protein